MPISFQKVLNASLRRGKLPAIIYPEDENLSLDTFMYLDEITSINGAEFSVILRYKGEKSTMETKTTFNSKQEMSQHRAILRKLKDLRTLPKEKQARAPASQKMVSDR